MMKTLTLTATMFALSMPACAKVSTDSQPLKTAENVPSEPVITMLTSKPGASVDLGIDFSNAVNPGDVVSGNIFVRDRYGEGTIKIDLLGGDGVNLLSDVKSATFSMSEAEDNVVPIQFTANQVGRQSITVLATVEPVPGQVMMRSITIPVFSGIEPQKDGFSKFESTGLEARKASEGGVVVMQAQEEIIQK